MKLDSCSVYVQSTKYVENSHITFRSLVVFQLLGMNDGMYGLHRPRMQLRGPEEQLTSPGLPLNHLLFALFLSFSPHLSILFFLLSSSSISLLSILNTFLISPFWAYISLRISLSPATSLS